MNYYRTKEKEPMTTAMRELRIVRTDEDYILTTRFELQERKSLLFVSYWKTITHTVGWRDRPGTIEKALADIEKISENPSLWKINKKARVISEFSMYK